MTEYPACKKKRSLFRFEFKTKAAAAMIALAATCAILQHSVFKENNTWADYLAGLTTEFAGVAATIILIDMVLERQERRRDIKRLADEMLFQVDYIVWVWLGGDRVFSYEEMLCLLDSVTPSDALHPVTETLLQGLGNEAGKRIRLQAELVNSDKHLCRGLCALSELASIRARKKPLTPVQVQVALQLAADAFAVVLTTTQESKCGQPWATVKNASPRYQYYRHCGELDQLYPEGADETLAYIS